MRAIGDVELLALSWQEFQEALERSDRAERDFSEIVQERLARPRHERGFRALRRLPPIRPLSVESGAH